MQAPALAHELYPVEQVLLDRGRVTIPLDIPAALVGVDRPRDAVDPGACACRPRYRCNREEYPQLTRASIQVRLIAIPSGARREAVQKSVAVVIEIPLTCFFQRAP